jgi:hypothetical protein
MAANTVDRGRLATLEFRLADPCGTHLAHPVAPIVCTRRELGQIRWYDLASLGYGHADYPTMLCPIWPDLDVSL